MDKLGTKIYDDKLSGLTVYGRNVHTGYNYHTSEQYELYFYNEKTSDQLAKFEIKSLKDLTVNVASYPKDDVDKNTRDCVKCLETLVRFGNEQNNKDGVYRYQQVTLDDNIKDKIIYRAMKDPNISSDIKDLSEMRTTNRDMSMFIQLKRPKDKNRVTAPKTANCGKENSVNKSIPIVSKQPGRSETIGMLSSVSSIQSLSKSIATSNGKETSANSKSIVSKQSGIKTTQNVLIPGHSETIGVLGSVSLKSPSDPLQDDFNCMESNAQCGDEMNEGKQDENDEEEQSENDEEEQDEIDEEEQEGEGDDERRPKRKRENVVSELKRIKKGRTVPSESLPQESSGSNQEAHTFRKVAVEKDDSKLMTSLVNSCETAKKRCEKLVVKFRKYLDKYEVTFDEAKYFKDGPGKIVFRIYVRGAYHAVLAGIIIRSKWITREDVIKELAETYKIVPSDELPSGSLQWKDINNVASHVVHDDKSKYSFSRLKEHIVTYAGRDYMKFIQTECYKDEYQESCKLKSDFLKAQKAQKRYTRNNPAGTTGLVMPIPGIVAADSGSANQLESAAPTPSIDITNPVVDPTMTGLNATAIEKGGIEASQFSPEDHSDVEGLPALSTPIEILKTEITSKLHQLQQILSKEEIMNLIQEILK